ncbi:MAG: hypothetical protein AAF740_09785, partial [Bacteroidota bacterium]
GENLLRLEVGVIADVSKLNSSFALLNEEGLNLYPSDWQGQTHLSYIFNYAQVGYKRNFKRLKVEAKGQLAWNQASFSTTNNQQSLYFLPNIRLGYELTKSMEVYTQYKESIDFPNLLNLHSPFILESIQRFGRGTNSFAITHTRRSILGWDFDNRSSGDKINLRIGYSQTRNAYRDSSTVTSDFQLATAFIQTPNDFFLASASYNRYFEELGLDFTLSTGWRQGRQSNQLNGEVRQLITTNYHWQANLGLALSKNFVVGAGGKWNQNYLRSLVSGSEQTNDNTFIDGFLNLKYKAGQKFSASLNTEFRYITNNWLYFVDSQLSYKLSDRVMLYLDAYNLANETDFRQVFLSDFASTQIQYQLLPRQILVGININL